LWAGLIVCARAPGNQRGIVMGVLDGKVAIVTGGASGLGLEIATVFVSEGASVAIVDVSGDEDEVVKSLGDAAVAIHGDVSDPTQADEAVAIAIDRFGRLDVLCNNAGIDGPMAPTADVPVEGFDRVVAVNLRGPFLMMKASIPALLRSGGGSIINIASAAGLVGVPYQSAYCATKGGLVQLTKAASLEYAKQGIRVNCICPGAIETPLIQQVFTAHPELSGQVTAAHPIGRIAQPAEVAAAVVFLASDQSSYVTGIALPVDGGYLAQ
jgi:NAD(P)-dependent dehydrogenase (short-subunit alcohol dehydrogenase family)